MSDYFEHVIGVYPIPRSKAFWVNRDTPYRITNWGTLPLWGLGWELKQHYDRIVFIVPGEQGGQRGLLQEQEGFQGYAPLTMPKTVFVQADAPEFVLAHELGHTYLGLGHNEENANDGWDVREVTGSGPKPEAMQLQPLMFPTANSSLDGWITYQEYDELLDQFVGGGSADSKNTWGFSGKLLTSDTEAQDLLVVSSVIPFSGEPTLFPVVQSFGTPDPVSLMGDNYTIVIRSRLGRELSRVDFDTDFIELGESGDVASPFLFALPYPRSTNKIELWKNSLLLESRKISKNPPSISIINVNPIDTTTFQVDIDALDLDGDVLDFAVSYTPDGERPYVVDFTWIEEGKSFQFDASGLPGSDEGKIRVLVTDGVLSASAYSESFSVPNQPPIVSIMSPIENAVFEIGSNVFLSGTAMDPEDGPLSGSSLVWESDLDGPLGEGERLEVPVSTLSIGTHQVKFIAIDSSGAESSTSTSITVVASANPDALVQRIDFYPIFPAVADEINIGASITNFGKDAVGTVSFYEGNPSEGGTLISSSEVVLPANVTTHTNVSWTPLTPGNKSIFVQIADLKPFEEVTDNNVTGETLEVSAGPLISVSPGQLDFGQEETLLNIVIENLEGGTLEWSITESGDGQNAVSVSPTTGFTPGKTKAFLPVKVNRPGVDNDTHDVTLTVSSNGGVSEIAVSYRDNR